MSFFVFFLVFTVTMRLSLFLLNKHDDDDDDDKLIGQVTINCLSLYGCELWNLQHHAIGNICKSWRHVMRRVWGLPANCRSAVVQILSDVLPLFDIICKRAVMFARNCLNSSSDVRYVANCGVYFGRIASGIGRNVFFGCENFSLPLNDLLSEKFNPQYVYKICMSRRTETESSNSTVVLCVCLSC